MAKELTPEEHLLIEEHEIDMTMLAAQISSRKNTREHIHPLKRAQFDRGTVALLRARDALARERSGPVLCQN